MKKTRITELLGIEYPIIQAPMAWLTNAELVAAVSNAGGLGCLGPNAGQTEVTTDTIVTGERLKAEIQKVRSLTDKPFAVNFVVLPDDMECPMDLESTFCGSCAQVIIDTKVPVVVISGFFSADYIKMFRDAGIKILFRDVIASSETAKMAESGGVDALIAVGYDAGGHLSDNTMPTLTLVPSIVDAVDIPVIAGGGIVDGRGIAAVMALGAEGVYIGTKFIAAVENPAHKKCKDAIISAGDGCTVAYRDQFGLMARILPSEKMMTAVQNNPKKTYADVITGGLKEGMLDGDLDDSIVTISTACGLIKEEQTSESIMKNLVGSATQTIKELQ